MIDANSQFFAILTAVGEAKQVKADAGLMTWKLTHMAVGDANNTDPIPDRLQKVLINERRRAPLNMLGPDPANPGILVAEQIIPSDEGGFWIRELGLFDSDGDLVAVANCAPSFKPKLSQGAGRTQTVRMNFIVKSSTNVVLNIDPAVVTATRH
jgi:phage-related tail fiber protein